MRKWHQYRVAVTAMLVITGMLYACGNEQKETHLPAEKMRAILTDMALAETYSTMLNDSSINNPGAKNGDSLGKFYGEILATHKITREAFDQSMAWYKQHPAEMDSLFAAMGMRATEWQKELEDAAKSKDSAAKAEQLKDTVKQ